MPDNSKLAGTVPASVYNTLQKEHTALQARYNALNEAHKELQAKLPVTKPVYEYADGECRPVPPIRGSVCGNCGFTYGGRAPKDLEPHPIGH